MNIHMHRTVGTTAAVIALLILAAAFPARIFAGENVPVTTDISITYIVDGNVKTAGGDRFTLTADDPQAPMPEGSADGKKTITIRDEGSFSFGEIYYERPEVYWYTITRDVTEKKGVVKDDSVYRAKVIALNDGHGYVLVYKDGGDEKHELIYKDRVAPATGDNSRLQICSGIAAAAAAALAIMSAAAGKRRRREVHDETENNTY